MARSTKKVIPKRRGRPAAGKDRLVSTRMPTTLIANVDAWADQIDIKRSEAIRRLVELGLTVKAPAKPATKPGRRLRAQELATKTIEKIIDPAAPPEERAQRRRRLTKAPTEFRKPPLYPPSAKRP